MPPSRTFQFSWLTPAAQKTIQEAISIAKTQRHATFGLWELAAALWIENNNQDMSSPLAQIFKAGLDGNTWGPDVQAKIEGLPQTISSSTQLAADEIVSGILDRSKDQAGTQLISPVTLWAELLREPTMAKQMEQFGLTTQKRRELLTFWGANPELAQSRAAGQPEEGSFIARFCKDLTAAAEAGQLDPVVGRDDEIREAMNILQRRTKNNPVIIGEPGVGKTALVEGLAQRMVKNEVPETLKGKKLMSLDLGTLVAGAKYKGELEERVKGLVKEIQDRSDVVLFIDEIHSLVSANGSAGGVGDLLKPALARGELRCIGATTPEEFRQNFEKDPALERRFQKVTVLEPSQEDAIAILRGIKDKYAVHHGVDITDSAIVAAVQLSARYITDRNLPDKAIDLLDAAAARVRTVLDSKPEQLDKLDRKLLQLRVQQQAIKEEENRSELDDDTRVRLVALEKQIQTAEAGALEIETRWNAEKEKQGGTVKLQEQLEQSRKELDQAIRGQDLAAMSEIQYGRIPNLEREIRAAQRAARKQTDALVHDQVDADQIAQVVAKWTGIPVAKMKGGEQEKLANLEKILNAKVIGQPEAVEVVSNAVRRSRSGLSNPNRPIGSFMFLGPTGVGKTELTKVLASFLFDRKEALVRLDMSEFMEKHSVSRLIGAPPGYVGYEEGGKLTEAIRQQPYSVILLDEVEKAHPDVFNILLQVLDEGHLTDSQGRTVDFKNTVVIMTSNLGASDIQEMTASGASQEDIEGAVMKQVKTQFRPEFINRLDDLVVFRPLDQEAILQIAGIQIKQVVNRLADRKINAVVSDEAVQYLAHVGFDPLMGARPLNRAIQQYFENPLAKDIVSGVVNSGDRLDVTAIDGKLVMTATPPPPEVDLEEEEAITPVSISPEAIEGLASGLASKTTSRRAKPTKDPKVVAGV